MDWSLRSKLLVGFATVVAVSAALTVPAGSFLIGKLVVSEAERRVVLGLRTADAMLRWRQDEARQGARSLADVAALRLSAGETVGSGCLEAWRATGQARFDFRGGSLAWTPDGSRLLYADKGRVWTVPAAGGEPTVISTDVDGNIHQFALSPDGKTIAFNVLSGGDMELWLMEGFLPLVKGR